VPVALTAGEVLGISKKLSGLLAELIKPRTVVKRGMYVGNVPKLGDENLADRFHITGIPEARMKEALIELPIKIRGNSLKAVINTGSQLNIVSERMYEKIIKLPIKRNETLMLHDTNGGRGHLRGLVSQVSINIGAILTTAKIYVGKEVPFDILLGRPWQIHNLVSIHERPTGTWLEFENSPTNSQVFEALVVPSRNSESHMDDARSWNITYSEGSDTRPFHQRKSKNSTYIMPDSIEAPVPDGKNQENCKHVLRDFQSRIVVHIDRIIDNCIELLETTMDSTGEAKTITEIPEPEHMAPVCTITLFQPNPLMAEYASSSVEQPIFNPGHHAYRHTANVPHSHSINGNHEADFLVLNRSQFKDLHSEAKHVIDFVPSIVVYTMFAMPNVISKCGNIIIPMFELPIDGRQICSPTPLAFAKRLDPGPFFKNYDDDIKRALR
jgi:hypothetical protein